MRGLKIGIVTAFGGFVGIGASLGLLLLVELVDRRMRTTEDLVRVTKLPVLTTLGDLEGMEDTERTQWAFRAWTMLQGRLSPSPQHGLVCGFTSSATGEGPPPSALRPFESIVVVTCFSRMRKVPRMVDLVVIGSPIPSCPVDTSVA